MKEKVKKMGLNIKSHKEFDKEVCVEYVVFSFSGQRGCRKNYSNKPPKR